MLELSQKLAWDPDTKETCAYSWTHRYLVDNSLAYFDKVMGHHEASAPRLREQLARMPPGPERSAVRESYMDYLFVAEEYDEMLRQVELTAKGVDRIGSQRHGVHYMQYMAKHLERPDLWERAMQLAIEAKERVKKQVTEDLEFRAYLLRELDAIMQRPMPDSLRRQNN